MIYIAVPDAWYEVDSSTEFIIIPRKFTFGLEELRRKFNVAGGILTILCQYLSADPWKTVRAVRLHIN